MLNVGSRDLRVVQHQHPGAGSGGLRHRQPRPAAVRGSWQIRTVLNQTIVNIRWADNDVQHQVGQWGPQQGAANIGARTWA